MDRATAHPAVTQPAYALRSMLARTWLPELLVLLLAGVTRFWQLGRHSFWFDEAVSLAWAAKDPATIWRSTFPLVEDKHPPAYYLTLHFWQQLLEPLGLARNDAALRSLGAILGVLTVLGLLLLARRLSGRPTALLAGGLAGMSPVLVWYSQELRMFQPATLGLVWAAAFLVTAAGREQASHRWLTWLALVLSLTYALYSYLFSALALPAAGLTLLLLTHRPGAGRQFRFDWQRLGEGMLALAVTGGLFLPLALNAWAVNGRESTPGRAFAGFLATLWRQLDIFTLWRVDWPSPWEGAALAFFAGLLLAGLLLQWKGRTASPDRPILLLWIGLPLLLGGALQATNQAVFREDRYFLFLAPFVLWAVARGAVTLSQRWPVLGWAGGSGALLLLLLALPQVWSPRLYRENWRAAANYIADYQDRSPGLPGGVVAHVNYTDLALKWYLEQRYPPEELPVFGLFGQPLTPDQMEEVIGPPLEGMETFLGAHTLWLTQSHLAGLDDQGLVERWLDEHYPRITEQFPAGIKLTGYALRTRYDALPTLGPDATFPEQELAPGLVLAACEVMTPQVTARDETMHPPSGWVHLRLWLTARAPLDADYPVVAQVVGPGGVWGRSLDREQDALHRFPSSQWPVGVLIRAELDVNMNPVTPPGTYSVVVRVDEAGREPAPCGSVAVE